ncbi:MAG: LuxR C-terminal-related transcriptional regulator [Planctomycetota bacterium]
MLILEQSHDLQAMDPFLARILKDAQHTRLILLAKTPPTRSVVALMKAGVECVLDKPVCGDALRLAVIRAGATEDSQDEGTAVQAFDVAPGSLQVLTAQQRRVAELIYQGKSNRQIADLLSIAVKTVECHRRQVMQRLEVRSAAALVRRLGEFKSP